MNTKLLSSVALIAVHLSVSNAQSAVFPQLTLDNLNSETSQSGYTLTQITAEQANELPASSVVKYYTVNDDNTLNEVYYQISIKDNETATEPINNKDTISETISGNFIKTNSKESTSGSDVNSGAIQNSGTLGDITGDFIGNGLSETTNNRGAAIYNAGNSKYVNKKLEYTYSNIHDITGDFVSNYAISTSGEATGAAIANYSYANINGITGNFIGNYTKSSVEEDSVYEYASAYGGAIVNYYHSTINDISGDFVGNYVSIDSKGYALGGGDLSGKSITYRKYNWQFYRQLCSSYKLCRRRGDL